SHGSASTVAATTGRLSPMTNAPPVPSMAVRKPRLESLNCWVIFASSSLHQSGRLVNGGTNARIGSAAADVVDVEIDVGVGRLGNVLQQRRDGHHDSGLAIAALRHVHFRPDLLEHVLAIGIEAFDSRD